MAETDAVTLSVREARHALARISAQALARVDLCLLMGIGTEAILSGMDQNGYTEDAVQAAREYIAAKRG